MEICAMIWVEFDKNKKFKDIHSTIVINVYKHYKDSYWCKDFLHMTYFEQNSLSISLHYNIMQHLIRSKDFLMIFSTSNGNISRIFSNKQSLK
jgi:hypothetical protein